MYILLCADGAAEHEAAPRTENQCRAAEDRLRCYRAGVLVQAELTADGQDTGLDSLGMRQKLFTQMRAGTY